jgi:hypothetical protein
VTVNRSNNNNRNMQDYLLRITESEEVLNDPDFSKADIEVSMTYEWKKNHEFWYFTMGNVTQEQIKKLQLLNTAEFEMSLSSLTEDLFLLISVKLIETKHYILSTNRKMTIKYYENVYTKKSCLFGVKMLELMPILSK